MTRKTTIIAGAAIAAMAAGAGASAPASAGPIPHAASYADLLEPVPDAMERLQTADAQHAATFQQAQFNRDRDDRGYDRRNDRRDDRRDYRGRDHHHHDYRDRRWYRNHGYSWYGGRWQIRPRHHHHHHHNDY